MSTKKTLRLIQGTTVSLFIGMMNLYSLLVLLSNDKKLINSYFTYESSLPYVTITYKILICTIILINYK